MMQEEEVGFVSSATRIRHKNRSRLWLHLKSEESWQLLQRTQSQAIIMLASHLVKVFCFKAFAVVLFFDEQFWEVMEAG